MTFIVHVLILGFNPIVIVRVADMISGSINHLQMVNADAIIQGTIVYYGYFQEP
jgi:hypothetical protein